MQLSPYTHWNQLNLVQETLYLGFCGECPTLTPSSTPSEGPSSFPTPAPTEPLDGCEVEPPSCSLTPPDGADRVTFCLLLGNTTIELCVIIENVPRLLDLGK